MAVRRRKPTAREVERAERLAKAVELRLAGVSYERISTILGYSTRAEAYRDLVKAWKEHRLPYVEEFIKQQFTRYERMLEVAYREARQGDWAAMDRVLRIMQAMERLILGPNYSIGPAIEQTTVNNVVVMEATQQPTDLQQMSHNELLQLYQRKVRAIDVESGE